MKALMARRTGFTLVELMIVVVSLATLAGVAIPYIVDESDEARIVGTQNVLRTIDTAVDLYRLRHTMPRYPETIMREWFAGRQMPTNTLCDDPAMASAVDVVEIVNANHPGQKLLGAGVKGFWYNKANGILRARVPKQGSDTESARLYERVNMVGRAFIPVGGGSLTVEQGGGEIQMQEDPGKQGQQMQLGG